jgi:hypothetical protein
MTDLGPFVRRWTASSDQRTGRQDAQNLDPNLRQHLRLSSDSPGITTFSAGHCCRSRNVLPKSPIGQAISYARAQWEDLQTYTRDGELSIDNNVSERSLRAQAIGRKNYMFVGSDRGGRTGATSYSLVASCKRLHVDPFAYLKDVLQRLPEHPVDRFGEFLPDVWMTANPDARRNAAS